MKKYALVVAGGSGQRMGSDIPKQFLELNGLPVLCHTLKAFWLCDTSIQIILVLPEAQIGTWQTLCDKFNFTLDHEIVAGGATRSKSVMNGLAKVPDNSLVAIHDGVRPLIQGYIIEESYRIAEQFGSGVVAVKLKDSVRQVFENSSQAIDRASLRLVQTPQTFKTALIKDAYSTVMPKDITDDAGVAEQAGIDITLVEGDYNNIKITTPEDLIIAQALLTVP